MTTPVIAVRPSTAVLDIAALLLKRRISGVPVVSRDHVVGIVSEGDLLHRPEIAAAVDALPRSWWRRLVDGDDPAADYVKTHGRTAFDVMTRNVTCVPETAPVAEIVSLLDRKSFRRLPVVHEDHLVGIVCRSDLVRALLAGSRQTGTRFSRSDEAIRVHLLAELEQHRWWRPEWSSVSVAGGVVRYGGLLQTEDERHAARVAAENVPGVRGVLDERTPVDHWVPLV
jgi:CBS domain-containing protein